MRLISWNIKNFNITDMNIATNEDIFRRNLILATAKLADIFVIIEVVNSIKGIDGVNELTRILNEPYTSLGMMPPWQSIVSPNNADMESKSADRYAVVFNKMSVNCMEGEFSSKSNATVLRGRGLGGIDVATFNNSIFGSYRNPYVWSFIKTGTNQGFKLLTYHAPESGQVLIVRDCIQNLAELDEVRDITSRLIIAGDFNSKDPNDFGPLTTWEMSPPRPEEKTSLVNARPSWEKYDNLTYCANPYDKILARNVATLGNPYLVNLISTLTLRTGVSNGTAVPQIQLPPVQGGQILNFPVLFPNGNISNPSDALWAVHLASDHLPIGVDFDFNV